MKRIFIAALFVLACALTPAVWAQSTDQSLPTPVLSNVINGKIAALDVGDPRATRHFYAFAASPGDLLITVDTKNLDGDVDVFTAITFRPLMKTTVYATSQSPSVTKGVYLRAHQLLILRIEARTPNDDPGTYRIHFGGTFEPFSGGIPVAENTESTERSNEKAGANRLSSVGATIPRPAAEMIEAEAKATPSPDKVAEKSVVKRAEKSESAKVETEKPATTSRTNTRPPRRTTSTSRRQPPAKKTDSSTRTEADAAKTEPKAEVEKSEPPKKDTAKVEKATKVKSAETRTSETSEKAKPQEIASQLPGTRLIIEQKDGTRIERPMSAVRRVVIEGATIVIFLKNGKTERVAMADVARMAIEPQ